MSTTEKIIVISLPRTGTKSLCKMLQILGYEVEHAPGPSYAQFVERVDAVADTPMFAPPVVSEMLQSRPEAKFIYIDKNEEQWAQSFERMGLDGAYNSMLKTPENQLSRHNKTDLFALGTVFGFNPYDRTNGILSFQAHKNKVLQTIPNDKLLVYRFSDGWESLARFLGKEVPDEDIPHMNKDTMFEDL